MRKKGDGSFRKLPNGSVEFTVELGNDIYGVRQRKRFYGKTEAECRKKHKQFIKDGEKRPAKSKEHTLSSWLDEWLITYKKVNVQDSTYEDYSYLAGYAKKHSIGNMKLSAIKPMHITDFFKSIINRSHSARKKARFLLNATFECAIDNDLCDRNPVRRAEIAKKAQPEKEPFTEDEARTIINYAKTDEFFGVAVYIMMNTGIRSGEMRAMSVEQIDFENGVITIDRAVKHTEELGKPKNGKTRYIPLEEDVVEFLQSKLHGESGYIVGGSHHVTRAGFRSRYLHFFNRLNKYLESMGQERIGIKPPHATRHTFSTLRQKNGMPIAMVSELLGHSSTEVTDKYTHLGSVDILSEAVRKYRFLEESA